MQSDDLRAIHGYHVTMTLFADAKAGALLVLFSGVLGAVFEDRSKDAALLFSLSMSALTILSALSLLLLAASIGMLAWVLYPRAPRLASTPGNPRNVIFWRSVAEYPNSKTYGARVASIAQQDLIDDWANEIYGLSKVVQTKFSALRVGLLLGLLGSAAAVASAVCASAGA